MAVGMTDKADSQKRLKEQETGIHLQIRRRYIKKKYLTKKHVKMFNKFNWLHKVFRQCH